MTEYDYSPEAYERFMRTQTRVGNWISDTRKASNEYGNPFVLSPAHASRALDAWQGQQQTQPPGQQPYPPRGYPQQPYVQTQTQPGPSRQPTLHRSASSSKPRSPTTSLPASRSPTASTPNHPTTRSPTSSKPEKPRGRDRGLGSSPTAVVSGSASGTGPHPRLNPKRSKTLPPNTTDPRPRQTRSRSHSHSQQRDIPQPALHNQPQVVQPPTHMHSQSQTHIHHTHMHTQSQPQPVQHQALRRTQSRSRSQSQGQGWQFVEKPATRSRETSKTRSPLSRSSSHRRAPHQPGGVSPSQTMKTSPLSFDRSPPTTPGVSIPASPPRGLPMRGNTAPAYAQSSYDGNSSTIYLPPGPPGQTYFVVPPPGGRVVAGDPADKVYPSRAIPTLPAAKQSLLKRLLGFITSSGSSHKGSEKSSRSKSRRSNRRSTY